MTASPPTAVLAAQADVKSSRGHALRQIFSKRSTIIGLIMLVFVLLVTILGPILAPYDISKNVGTFFEAPSAKAWLGTDYLGRDVLSRVLHGGVTVVTMSVLAATLGTVLGAALGMTAAYRRGIVDEVIMRISDVLLALPLIVFVLLLVAVFGHELWLLVLLIGISHAPQVARVVRGVAVEVREREFVEYGRSLGASGTRMVFTQILPNISTPLLVEYGLRIVWSIAAFASLSVLGQGVQAPMADWGLMVNENRQSMIAGQPLSVLVPLLMIAVFALAVNLITDGISSHVARGGDA